MSVIYAIGANPSREAENFSWRLSGGSNKTKGAHLAQAPVVLSYPVFQTARAVRGGMATAAFCWRGFSKRGFSDAAQMFAAANLFGGIVEDCMAVLRRMLCPGP